MTKNKNKKNRSKAISNRTAQIKKPVLGMIITSENISVNPQAQNSKFQTFLNVITKFWLLISAIIGLTGYSIFNVLPGLDFTLKNTSDQNLLVVEFKNKSWIQITNIEPKLFIYKLFTTEGDSVNRLQVINHNHLPKKLGGNQKYTIDYGFNEMLFMYNRRPQYIQALMALEVKYKYLFFNCKDKIFVECRPDYHGDFIWLEMQDQDWFESMNADTTRSKLDDLPYAKRLMKNKKIKNSPIPPIPKN